MNGNARCGKNRKAVRIREFPDSRNMQEICRKYAENMQEYTGIRRITLRGSRFLAIIHEYIGQ